MDPVRSRSPSPERALPPTEIPIGGQDQRVQHAAGEYFPSALRGEAPIQDAELLEMRSLTLKQIIDLPLSVIESLPDPQLENVLEEVTQSICNGSIKQTIDSFLEEVPEVLTEKWYALRRGANRLGNTALARIMESIISDIEWHNKQVDLRRIGESVSRIEEKDARIAALIEELRETRLRDNAEREAQKQAFERQSQVFEEQLADIEARAAAVEAEEQSKQEEHQKSLGSLSSVSSTGSSAPILNPPPERPPIQGSSSTDPQLPRPSRNESRLPKKCLLLAVVVISIAAIYFGRSYANKGSTLPHDEL